MNLFNVYPLFNIAPVKAAGEYVWDSEGKKYLDLYGGHAVISIGHAHPTYVEKMTTQLHQIAFYSNSVQIPQQQELAERLGRLSGCDDYQLFLINSGAEANENAIKVASFATGRKKILSFDKSFHGRTSAAVAATDNPKIIAPVNETPHVKIVPFGNLEAVEEELKSEQYAAVIIEGIQGVGGIRIPEPAFLESLAALCKKHGTKLILDEIQSGYGRSGRFFAFQYANVKPDLITMAKGMGNGFPIGGVLIAPDIAAVHGMLGTTFGGNYLACAAANAVLEVLENERLIEHSKELGTYLMNELRKIPQIKEVRGYGLMIGLEFQDEVKEIRRKLLFEELIFTGVSGANIIRLLPPLTLSKAQADYFVEKLKKVIR
ncbi:MAG: aspartate aminotransferase family protein [Mangrovibacterium sp.]